MLLCWLKAIAVGHTDTSSTDSTPAVARAEHHFLGCWRRERGQLSLTAQICSGNAAQGKGDHRWKWQWLVLVPFSPSQL